MLLEIGTEWPPKCDRRRLQLYDRYQKFFKGEHQSAFRYLGARSDIDKRLSPRKIALIMNYPALITKASTDLLCGEAPKFVASGPNSKAAQEVLDQLVKKNRFESVLYATQTVTSFRGDGVFRVRDNGQRIVIEQVPAHNYFVMLDPDNDTEVLAQCVAWIREDPSGCYLRVEHHEAGRIINEAYVVQEKKGQGAWGVVGQVPLAQAYSPPYMPPAEEETTGLDFPLVWHVSNFYDGESYWGWSDYSGGLDTLFEALNNRLSKIDSYLDRHQRPILVGLPGMADTEGALDSRQDYLEPQNPDQAKDLPRYVTWDGQMEAAFRELDELKRQIRVQSETPKRLLGESEDTSIDSGRAMLNDFIPIEKKVNRKRTLVDPVVKEVLMAAMELHKLRYQMDLSVEAISIDIKWQDGVPQDYMEAAQTESTLVQNSLTSKQSAMERLFGIGPEESKAELERMDAEKKAATPPALSQAQPGDTLPGQPGEMSPNGIRTVPVTGAAANGAVGARNSAGPA